MLNFTVGPVMRSENTIKASLDIPYFRTNEFSKIMLENERILKKYFYAEEDAKVIFLTSSGTGAMDATVLNFITNDDKVLIINGGTFGNRFVEICKFYGLNYTEIKCEFGKTLTKNQLDEFDNKDYTVLLVNMDETSSGVLYDMEMISNFCKRNDIFLIVDSISSFLCDEFNMQKLGVNVVFTSSQKALALSPGLSILCLDSKAMKKLEKIECKSFYFNYKNYIENSFRGQTPFTPAVGVILELNVRLNEIEKNGGIEKEIERTSRIAEYFRKKIIGLPFKIVADRRSNAVTALMLTSDTKSATNIFNILKNEYNIFVCPNGGIYKDKIFRVGHIGNIKFEDIDRLISAFNELRRRDIL